MGSANYIFDGNEAIGDSTPTEIGKFYVRCFKLLAKVYTNHITAANSHEE